MNIFSCIHQSQLKPSVYLERDEDFWGWEGFSDVLARARRVWCYYARVMHAGFGSFPAVLQQCQLTSHLSSAAIIKPTCLSTLHPFLFAAQIRARLCFPPPTLGVLGGLGSPLAPALRPVHLL